MTINIKIDWLSLLGNVLEFERERTGLTQIEAAKKMKMALTTYREKEYGKGLNPIFIIKFSVIVLKRNPNYVFEQFLKVVRDKGLNKDLFGNPAPPRNRNNN